MKKIGFYITAILFTLLYLIGAALLNFELQHFSPLIIVWLAALWAASICLDKGKWWGGLIGFIPVICFIYMGTQETGQIIKETWAGIILLVYFIGCAYFVWRKNQIISKK